MKTHFEWQRRSPALFLFVFALLTLEAQSWCDDGLRTSDTYEQILEWRSKHEEKFRSPTGWLALVGHYWLVDGENSLGSEQTNVVQLPSIEGLKASGNFRLAKNKVSLHVDPGSQVLVNDKSIEDVVLAIDSSLPETNGTDSIQVGDRITLQLVRRNDRYAVRVRDSQSPLLVEFKGKHWHRVDPKYCVDATFKKFDTPKSVKIINIKGDETESKLIGKLEFTIDQRTFSLDALADSPDELFIIFKDKTSGKSSYGAGRFLDIPIPTDSDKVVLDFNKAYSPPCAFSPHTLCPLPPKQNHLDIAIEAGESIVRSAEPDPKEVVKKIIAAAGGEEKLFKLFRIKERLNVTSDPEKKGNERVSILEPPKYWWIGKSERGPEPAKFLAWAWTLGALIDPASRVEVIPEVTESNKPALGLRISQSVDPPMDLYFDKDSYQLVRIDWRTDIHRLSEWQDREGVKYPAKCTGYKKSTGTPWYFSEIIELERLNDLPEGLKR